MQTHPDIALMTARRRFWLCKSLDILCHASEMRIKLMISEGKGACSVSSDDYTSKHSSYNWTDCIMGKILKKVEMGKFITTALKSILKLVKLQSLVAKRCKMWKM